MSRLSANLLLLSVAAIWGSTFVIQQIGLQDLGPLLFTGARFLLGGLLVLPLAWWETQRPAADHRPLTGRDAAGFAVTGLALGTAATLQQIGILGTSVSNAGFLTALYVPLVPLLAVAALRVLPHWSIWPGAGGCVIGTYLLGGGSLDHFQTGDFWVMAGAAFWAVHVLLIGIMSQRTGRPFLLACGQFLICGAVVCLIGLALEEASLAAFSRGLPAILYGGLLSVGLGFTGQVIGQRHTTPADAAIILSAETVFAALCGAVFLDERLSWMAWGGAGLILASILSVQVLPLFIRSPSPSPG